MKLGCRRLRLTVLLACFYCFLCPEGLFAKMPEGFKDIKLGMKRSHIVETLSKSPGHYSFEELGDEITEVIRGDNLFRFAIYRFNAEDELMEIDLQMREILGRDKVLEIYNTEHGLSLSPNKVSVESNKSIEVKDNRLILKMALDRDKRSAKGTE